jgi:hypothetical protein
MKHVITLLGIVTFVSAVSIGCTAETSDPDPTPPPSVQEPNVKLDDGCGNVTFQCQQCSQRTLGQACCQYNTLSHC